MYRLSESWEPQPPGSLGDYLGVYFIFILYPMLHYGAVHEALLKLTVLSNYVANVWCCTTKLGYFVVQVKTKLLKFE